MKKHIWKRLVAMLLMVTVLTMDLGTTVFAVPSDGENTASFSENTSSDPSQVYSEEYTPVTTQEPQILSEVEE